VFAVETILHARFPKLENKPWLRLPLRFLLRRLLHEREFQEFETKYPHLQGIDFVEQVLEYFAFSYSVRDSERERIPVEGKVVIIANHPIGSLDGLALIKLVSEVRPDVKVVANELLMAVKPLEPLLLPVNNMSGGTARDKLRRIHSHLLNEGALVIFPAGEVSRMRPQGVRDTRWQDGFLRIAERARAPVLPVHLEGRNSSFFYSVSMIYKPLATALLVTEMFKQRQRHLPVRIGELIAFEAWQSVQISGSQKVRLFKKHLYRIAHDRKPIFRTTHSIALPENRKELMRALQQSEVLGTTGDGKIIYLHRHQPGLPVLREIGRLRELSFRAVGEGTNQRRDTDAFDPFYLHLVLWDPSALEIVGAYRLGDAAALAAAEPGLYSASLFDYRPGMAPYLQQGLELGRGFVQPRYWGKRSLDYLWLGIGAFLTRYPDYRYLFGPVSISGALPDVAKELLVSFYSLYFPSSELLATARHPWQRLTDAALQQSVFSGDDYPSDFRQLKSMLAQMGVAVPTMYKQYAELCSPGGVRFLAFGVDSDFGNCIDGLILVDLEQLLPSKRRRYLNCQGNLAD
jgi:putative hemolysin